MMQENINALDEIHKGACMGEDALTYVMEKVEDHKFLSLLKKEYESYDGITKKIEGVYSKYNDGKPHDTSILNKMMTDLRVQFETMTDISNSHIAEFLLKGVNMGVIEGRRILNQKKMNSETRDIIKEYVTMQENFVEELKSYL
ncbi:MAG: hypothetical protein IJ704_01555 [Bacilli bacterium]|nr:hypothetical protein [Bacilli bacterium]